MYVPCVCVCVWHENGNNQCNLNAYNLMLLLVNSEYWSTNGEQWFDNDFYFRQINVLLERKKFDSWHFKSVSIFLYVKIIFNSIELAHMSHRPIIIIVKPKKIVTEIKQRKTKNMKSVSESVDSAPSCNNFDPIWMHLVYGLTISRYWSHLKKNEKKNQAIDLLNTCNYVHIPFDGWWTKHK